MVANTKLDEVTADTDSDGEIGLGIPYSILKLPGVDEEDTSDDGGKPLGKKDEVFFQRGGKNGSVKRASLLIEQLHGGSSTYIYPESKGLKGNSGSQDASGEPVEVDFTVVSTTCILK